MLTGPTALVPSPAAGPPPVLAEPHRAPVELAAAATTVADVALDAQGVEAFAADVCFVPERKAAVAPTRCHPLVGRGPATDDNGAVPVPFGAHHEQAGSIHCAVDTVPRWSRAA